jgi:CRP-like cAMP-binding protein
VMERRPEIAREIIRVLARRLRNTTKSMVGRMNQE